MVEAKTSAKQKHRAHCLGPDGKITEATIELSESQAKLLSCASDDITAQMESLSLAQASEEERKREDTRQPVDLVPMHKGELPVLERFLDAVMEE